MASSEPWRRRPTASLPFLARAMRADAPATPSDRAGARASRSRTAKVDRFFERRGVAEPLRFFGFVSAVGTAQTCLGGPVPLLAIARALRRPALLRLRDMRVPDDTEWWGETGSVRPCRAGHGSVLATVAADRAFLGRVTLCRLGDGDDRSRTRLVKAARDGCDYRSRLSRLVAKDIVPSDPAKLARYRARALEGWLSTGEGG